MSKDEDMAWLHRPPADILSATATREFTRLIETFHETGPEVLANVVLEAVDEWGAGFGDALVERIRHHIAGIRETKTP